MSISVAIIRRCGLLVVAGLLCGCGRLVPLRGFAVSRPLAPEVTATEVLPPSGGYLQSGPVLANSETLNAAPATATEQLVELRKQLDELRISHASINARVQQMNAELAAKEQQLVRAEDEIQLTKQECASVHEDLEGWRHDVEQLHNRLARHQRREMDALHELEVRLAQALAVHLPEPSRRETRGDEASLDSPTSMPAPTGEEEQTPADNLVGPNS